MFGEYKKTDRSADTGYAEHEVSTYKWRIERRNVIGCDGHGMSAVSLRHPEARRRAEHI